MSSMRNKVQLIGHLGSNPEVKVLPNDKTMARFPLATRENYKNEKGERISETQWHNIVAWGNTARIAEKYLSKGQEVALEGKLTTRSYEDKSGVKRYFTEVIVSELLLLGSGRKEN